MNPYELEELKKFIRDEISKGYSIDTIKSTLHSSGFAYSDIKKAFATLNKKTKIKDEKIEIKIPKPKGPGFFEQIFAKKTKYVKKTKPKKKEKGLIESFFFKKEKTKIKKPTKPKKKTTKKPKKQRLFKKLFTKHTKTKPPKK
ncbi:hypothetical protein GF358_00360, partial [Candidatus Woesearchaeota archaeon]|nr:hypothetical protein [Candidatus Woesearchaeota archaeon]